MKKINELEAKLRAKIQEMDELIKNEQMTEEQVRSWDEMKAEVTSIQDDLKRAKEQEEYNKILAGQVLRNEDDGEKKDIVRSFFKAANEYTSTNGRSISKEFMGKEGGLLIPKELFRADPILSTTNTALVNVGIENSLAMVTALFDFIAEDAIALRPPTVLLSAFHASAIPELLTAFCSRYTLTSLSVTNAALPML